MHADLGTKCGDRNALLIWGSFASHSLPISIVPTMGLCPQRKDFSTRRHSQVFTKPKIIAPADHVGVIITPDKQEKEEAAILTEIINSDNHKEVEVLLIIGTARHLRLWNPKEPLWCFPF